MTVTPATTPAGASLLDLDPVLGAGVPAQDWELARRVTRTRVVRLGSGERWRPGSNDASEILGVIVIEGVLGREVALSDHHMLELLCPDDAVLPPGPPPGVPGLGSGTAITALTDSLLTVLGSTFLRAAARWPALLANVLRRVETQRERLAVQGLVAHLPRADDRVLMTLWLLAESCGRVTPQGTVLPLALTHETLGRLAAARRPTVTIALHRLQSDELVVRTSRGQLALTPAAERRIDDIVTPGSGSALARSIMLTKGRSSLGD